MKTHAPYGMEIADDCATCPMRKDGFFCQMRTETLADFQKMKFTSTYPAGAVLFVESQVPRGVYMLCKGRVKLTMASPGGKTVIVRVVEGGRTAGPALRHFRRCSRSHGRDSSTLPGRFRPAR